MRSTIKQLPKEQEQLENATAQIACIANGLADDLRKQCLEEYIGILKNVEKNYNRLQEGAEAWQKKQEKRRRRNYYWIFVKGCLVVEMGIFILIIYLHFKTY